MRYTIAYITGAIIASIGGVFLLIAFATAGRVSGSEVETASNTQEGIMYLIVGVSLLAAAVQFVVLGHLLTEIRDLREDMKR